MTDRISDLLLERNNQYLAFNKPAGLNVQPTDEDATSLLKMASAYAKRSVFLLHRLDRPVSGVVLFPKTKNALQHFEEQWRNATVRKTYLALVKNPPAAPSGTLVHHLRHDTRRRRSEVVAEGTKNAKRAELNYRLLATGNVYSLLEVELITGRFHQIRVQLAAVGSPVRGDVKYGARRGNRDRSIGLHAWKLAFDHPASGERTEVVAPPPPAQPWADLWNEVTTNAPDAAGEADS